VKLNTYSIWIRTGTEALAGTDSNVFIQIYGTEGKTESIHLPAKDIFSFEEDSVDKFILEVPDLGELTRCCIGHDGSVDSGWFVVDVRVADDETDREWHFPFNRWIGIEESGKHFACADC
jgi:hypothetical protein